MPDRVPDAVVLNLHKRYTGVSATVRSLLPIQRRDLEIALVDTGRLGLEGTRTFSRVMLGGFRKPDRTRYRILHARRDVEMIAGIVMRDVLRQKWRLVFTSTKRHRPNPFLRTLMNRMDAVIATSAHHARLLDWYSDIIPHGVDTGFFAPPDVNGTEPLPKPRPGKHVIVTLGRIRYLKGTDLFVAAMVDLLPRFPDFAAVIAGQCRPRDRTFLKDLRERIDAARLSDRIVFVGELDRVDAKRLYQGASLCIAASRTEGFGLTPLEAFACGVPVVASTAGVWPYVIDDSVGGIFRSGSLDDLKMKLLPILQRPERLPVLGAQARQRAVALHSVDLEASRINEIYRRLMEGDVLPRRKADPDASVETLV